MDYCAEINLNLICPICHSAFDSPVTSSICGHTFCRGCIDRFLEMDDEDERDQGETQVQQYCPSCRSPISSSSLKPADKIISNLVDELEVFCSERESGCNWTGQRSTFRNHVVADCQHRSVECDICKGQTKLSQLETHRIKCLAERFACPHCHVLLVATELDSHSASCLEVELSW